MKRLLSLVCLALTFPWQMAEAARTVEGKIEGMAATMAGGDDTLPALPRVEGDVS